MSTETFMNIIRGLFVLLFVLLFFAVAGCAGSVTTVGLDGSKTSKPAAVAVMEASALSHSTCEPSQQQLDVTEITKLSASAQAEYMRNVPMMMVLGLLQDKDGGCHAQVASATKEYFRSQATKYRQFGNFGQTIGRWVGGYLIADSVIDGIAAAGAVGDTNVGEINVSAGSQGAAGEEFGVPGGSVNQNVNIGNGTLTSAGEGGVNAFGEKPILGDGNTFNDNDSPSTSVLSPLD